MIGLDHCYLKSVSGKTCESCSKDFIRKPGMLTVKVNGQEQHFHADCFSESEIGKRWKADEDARKRQLSSKKPTE